MKAAATFAGNQRANEENYHEGFSIRRQFFFE